MSLNLIVAFILVAMAAALSYCSYDTGYKSASFEKIASYESELEALKSQAQQALDNERKAYKEQELTEAQYLERLRELEHNEQTIINEYRANTLKLRESLKPKQCAHVSTVTATTSHGDAEATGGLQDTDVTFLIRLAARADAVAEQLSAAQQIIEKDRELCNANY